MPESSVWARDLDLRQLRYFVAVAERLHFGRAAAALYITQPALSRQIRQLEQDIGVPLFTRTSRAVTLTPAGEQLARDATRLLAGSHAVVERARRADNGDQIFTVGFMLGADIDAILSVFSASHPEVDLQLKRVRWWSQADAILNGTVDVAFVRLPINAAGLTVLPLYTEALCVALPTDHLQAPKAALEIVDVADEPVLVYADAPSTWNAFWTVDPRPDGSRPRQGPSVRDMEEILEYVRSGRGVIFLPVAIAEVFPREGIAYVPIDIPHGQVALCWDPTRNSTLIDDLVESVPTIFHQ